MSKSKLLIIITLCSFVMTKAYTRQSLGMSTFYDGDSPHSALVLQFKSGKTLSYYLADKPEITFTANKLNIVSDYVTMSSFERSSIEDFHFAEIASDVEEIQKEEIRIVYNDNAHVYIYGLPFVDNHVSVCDVNGKNVPAEVTKQNESIVVSLNSCSAGIYIISINNSKSIKIRKK